MKKFFIKTILGVAAVLGANSLYAQGVAINNDNSAAHSSAMLDVKSTSSGILIPRMTDAQKTAIATPATGLLIFQTDGTAGFYYFNGTIWVFINAAGVAGTAGANGTNGTNGLTYLSSTAAEPAGANCANGGTKIQMGLDANSNSTLDAGEINAALTRYVCNGAAGANGTNGTNGAAGANGTNGLIYLSSTVAEPAGANCANGGTKIQMGLDANSNSTLDAGEINAALTRYVCNGVGVPTGGTAGQVLTKIDATNYNTQWTTPSGGSGTITELVATKTTGSQVLANANGTNTGDIIVFNNASTTPTIGSYNAATGVYTVGATGAGTYLIQAIVSAVDNASPSQTVGCWIYVEVNNSPVGSPNNIYPPYIASAPANLPLGIKSVIGQVVATVKLNAGDTFRIKGLAANTSVIGTALKTDGNCRLIVVKLN